MQHKPMKILAGLLFGSFFLQIGNAFGFVTKAVHWQLLIVAVVLMGVDFLTAMAKLKVKKIEPSSEGYRKTISKFSQYGGAVAVSYLLFYLFRASFPNAITILNVIIMAIMFVEITSIFENLYEVDSKSYFAKYFIYPALWIMKFSMVKNPVMKQMEKMQEEEKKKETNGAADKTDV